MLAITSNPTIKWNEAREEVIERGNKKFILSVLSEKEVGSRDYFLTPYIERQFSSPLNNLRNLELGRINDREILDRVLENKKPISFYEFCSEQELKEFAGKCVDTHTTFKYHNQVINYRHYPFVCMAKEGKIADHFDLDALQHDYFEWFSCSDARESASKEIERLRKRQFSDFIHFGDVEVDLSKIMKKEIHPLGEYLRTGLLLGYPPQSTAALVGNNLKMPGFEKTW